MSTFILYIYCFHQILQMIKSITDNADYIIDICEILSLLKIKQLTLSITYHCVFIKCTYKYKYNINI